MVKESRIPRKEMVRLGILKEVRAETKHRYLMPLDGEMRKQIEPLGKPYPKRPKQAMAGSTGTAEGQHLPGRSTLGRA